jgi:hypothetical protein
MMRPQKLPSCLAKRRQSWDAFARTTPTHASAAMAVLPAQGIGSRWSGHQRDVADHQHPMGGHQTLWQDL